MSEYRNAGKLEDWKAGMIRLLSPQLTYSTGSPMCWAFAILMLFTLSLPAGSPGSKFPAEFERVVEAIYSLQPDPAKMAHVEAFGFSRDAGQFFLQKGELFLCNPLGGKIVAAVFIGKGTFSIGPPTKIEQDQLRRFYGTNQLSRNFNTLVIFFADTTEAELSRRLTFAAGKVQRKHREAVKYALRYLGNEKKETLDYSLLKTMLDGEQNGLFFSHFSRHKTEPLFFKIDPFSSEQVQFARRMKGPSFLNAAETICQFHTQDVYEFPARPLSLNTSAIDILHYEIDCNLAGGDLDFSAETRIDFLLYGAGQRWIPLVVFEELEIDSLTWGNGEPAVYAKGKESPYIWIRAADSLRYDIPQRLILNYHGDLIRRDGDWFFIRSSKGWYPRHGTRDKSTFDITFHYPEKMQFASIGTQVQAELEEKTMTVRHRATSPIRNASFNIGYFTTYEIDNDSIPPVTVLFSEDAHRRLRPSLAFSGIGSGKNMEKQVGKDIKNSILLFQDIFGDPPARHFQATEIPYTHGEAFPGLLHLGWVTFQRTADDGTDETFRAHETAHQWWGIGVDTKTYHDLWISEGFCEFAGWRYLEEVARKADDLDRFYAFLKSWRERITGNRKFLFGNGQEAAPIWLGYRTVSSDTKGDYNLIVYKKGAWVLHMLRTMYTSLEDGSDESFRALTRSFYQEYLHGYASTEDFIIHTETLLGDTLGWFFDQWVYGTELPAYEFAQQIEENGDGTWRINCRVEQKEVSNGFRMPVLFGVKFNKHNILTERVWIDEPVVAFKLGPYPEKPEKVLFNYHESVLCTYKNVKWE